MDQIEILNDLIEIQLPDSEAFLKVKETLTRIGVAPRDEKRLYQSCHILYKQNKYFIVHFKEMFSLDGKSTNFSEEDRARRNTIAGLLAEWGLVTIINPSQIEDKVSLSRIKIIPFKDKSDWKLIPKYTIGAKKF